MNYIGTDVQQRRIFWEEPKKDRVRGTVLTYDGTPFLIQSLVVLSCQHGNDKNLSRKRKQALQQRVEKVFTVCAYSI